MIGFAWTDEHKAPKPLNHPMRRTLLWLIVAALVIGFVLYLARTSSNRLNIDRHAAEEIEKAKRR